MWSLLWARHWYVATFDRTGDNGKQWHDHLQLKSANGIARKLLDNIDDALREENAVDQVKKILGS